MMNKMLIQNILFEISSHYISQTSDLRQTADFYSLNNNSYVQNGFLYLILTRCTFTVYLLFNFKGDQMLTIAWWPHRWPGSAVDRRRTPHSCRSVGPAATPVEEYYVICILWKLWSNRGFELSRHSSYAGTRAVGIGYQSKAKKSLFQGWLHWVH